MNFVLVGARGSGKSSVGPLLAKRLGWGFVDVDEEIARSAGRSVREIFEGDGEAGFRQRERETCQKLRRLKDFVIALGGGALMDPEIRGTVRRLGKVVWLRAPAAVLWSRIKHDPRTSSQRPDLTAQGGLAEMEALLAERERMYEASAHHVVDTVSMSPDEIAEAIEMWFEANDAQSS